jgi:hypothetical protein
MASNSHLTDTVTTTDTEVLHFGVELTDCHSCGTALVAGEDCPSGCAHRGRRRAPRRRLDEVLAGSGFGLGDGLADLADAALEGRLAHSRLLA